MPVVRELITKLGYKIDDGDLKTYDSQLGNIAGTLGKLTLAAIAAAGAMAVIGAKAFISNLVTTNIEFERLKASLNTVTGSAENGAAAFKQIQDFASTTPFSLQEVSSAFIKLKSLGIDPTEARLRSFGNTAAAMGKPLDQFIEAVADASTGEFERLKEFGIKSSKQGDQVKFTFQGVTTTVKNNSEAINGFLQSIGDNNFAGAMEAQLLTLGGIVSNLQDNFSKFLLTVGEAGFNDALRAFLQTVRDLVGAGDDLAVSLGVGLGKTVLLLNDALVFTIKTFDTIVFAAKALGVALTLASPIGLLIAGLVGIGLAIEDIITLVRGGDSLFAEIFGPKIATIVRAFGQILQRMIMRRVMIVIEVFNRLKTRVMEAMTLIQPAFELWVDAIKRLIGVLLPATNDSDVFADLMIAMIPVFERAVIGLTNFILLLIRMSTVMVNISAIVIPLFKDAFEALFTGASISIELFSGNFEAAKNLWLTWLDQVASVASRLGVDLSGITGAIKSAASLVGISPSQIAATSAGGAQAAGAGNTTNTNTSSVGAVVVNVAGTTNMGPAEMAAATQAGTTRGLRDALSDANRNTQGALT